MSISRALLLTLYLICSSLALENAQGDAFALVTPPPPATEDLRFEHLTTEQGLSSNRVFSLLPDSRGFLWIGTTDGLNRCDSHSFKVYKHNAEDPDSLSDNVIRTLYEDREGNLWIGTYTSGLDRYNRETEKFTHCEHDPADPHSLGSNGFRRTGYAPPYKTLPTRKALTCPCRPTRWTIASVSMQRMLPGWRVLLRIGM